jgi:hypothetical protein
MNQRQLQIIDYLREENRVLREQLGARRLRLKDDQRRRLAAKAKELGRKILAQVATLCLDRMIWFGEGSLRKAIQEFVGHYHGERNHQGLGNRLLMPGEGTGSGNGAVQRRERLGGMLNYYYRAAAGNLAGRSVIAISDHRDLGRPCVEFGRGTRLQRAVHLLYRMMRPKTTP